jgi:phosphoribosylformimino-5-aminoimidazole carboxamide ribotide isomerase
MEIIPVIDLKGGIVVHAQMGRRELYRPIQTPLARTSNPVDVVAGIISIYSFATFYIADLDAIGGSGSNHATIVKLKRAFPQVTFWIDNGIADIDLAEKWLQQDLGYLVLGSETQADTTVVDHFSEDPRFVLSLDFREAEFQGPPTLLMHADRWPHRVIVMTLDRVGSRWGPDMERLRAIKAPAKARAIYAAGGIRDAQDLRTLAIAGIAGALVASSLHDGRLTTAGIQQLRKSFEQGAPCGSSLL